MTVVECPHGTEANVHCPQCSTTDAWVGAVESIAAPAIYVHSVGPTFELTWGARCNNCNVWVDEDEPAAYVDDELCCYECVEEAKRGKW